MQPVTVQWMEWPAEVAAGQPFRTRLIVWGVCAVNPRFQAGPSADESAVTFEPYFLLSGDAIYCRAAQPVERLAAIPIDTAGMAPALSPDLARAYEMRASASVYVGTARALASLPVRTFGSVIVRPGEPNSTNHNAAGYVSVGVDTLGCVRVLPAWTYGPGRGIVIDNPDDTIGIAGAFVRGFIYDLTVPKCGETRAFHLVAVN
ncbi:MAG TPA: hypothetical protein VFO67_06515 [Gemmatimonadales bacterium]|nr:hypothetical protein [Gemmatimonadales bacterium]